MDSTRRDESYLDESCCHPIGGLTYFNCRAKLEKLECLKYRGRTLCGLHDTKFVVEQEKERGRVRWTRTHESAICESSKIARDGRAIAPKHLAS